MKTKYYLFLIITVLFSLWSCSKDIGPENDVVGVWNLEKVKRAGRVINFTNTNTDFNGYTLYINEDYYCNLIDPEGYTRNHGSWMIHEETLVHHRPDPDNPDRNPSVTRYWLIFFWDYPMPELNRGVIMKVDRNDLHLAESRDNDEFTYFFKGH